MSTQLRDMFDAATESEVPNGITQRAIEAARQRRRQRYVVGGAVLATAAVVLGVVVAVSDVRMDAEPKPTDVASIPEVMPSPSGLPNLEPGMMSAASVAYINEGALVLVDSQGEAAQRYFGPPPQPNGLTELVAVPVTDVALSPDGSHAVVTVEGLVKEERPSTRVLDVKAAEEVVVPDLTPADDAGGVTVTRPSVYAWANDSASFYCACSAGSEIPRPHVVTLQDDGVDVAIPSDLDRVSPTQIVAGTVGAFSTEGESQSWWHLQASKPLHQLEGYAVAIDRESGSTYLEFRLWGSTLASFSSGEEVFTFAVPPAAVDGEYVVATDVEAVVGGFVAVFADAKNGEDFGSPSEAITQLRAIYLGSDGDTRQLTTFPKGSSTATFASDLVAP